MYVQYELYACACAVCACKNDYFLFYGCIRAFRAAKKEGIDDADMRPGGAAGIGAGAGAGGSAVDSLALMGTAEMREALIPLLLSEETVVQALKRLGARAKGLGDRGNRPG